MSPFAPSDFQARPRRSLLGRMLPWSLLIIALGAGGAFYMMRYAPLVQSQSSLMIRFNEKSAEHEALQKKLTKLEDGQRMLATQKQQLERELQRTADEREAALKELQQMHDELSSKLEDEITEGNVLIQRRGDDLVVDVADQILFPKGEAEVSDRGRAVLAEVAATMRPLAKFVIQVGGHTDSAPITSSSVKERYETNWELSTARATQVVRFLLDEGKIPGSRLVASGYAEFRPRASNRSRTGRQRNRRIEMVLLRKTAPKSGGSN